MGLRGFPQGHVLFQDPSFPSRSAPSWGHLHPVGLSRGSALPAGTQARTSRHPFQGASLEETAPCPQEGPCVRACFLSFLGSLGTTLPSSKLPLALVSQLAVGCLQSQLQLLPLVSLSDHPWFRGRDGRLHSQWQWVPFPEHQFGAGCSKALPSGKQSFHLQRGYLPHLTEGIGLKRTKPLAQDARSHTSLGEPGCDTSDGPGVSVPTLGLSLGWIGHVFTQHTSAPCASSPHASCGGPGGAGEALPGPAGLLGAQPWLGQHSLGTQCVLTHAHPGRGHLIICISLAEAAERRSGPQYSPAEGGFTQLSPCQAWWQI